MGVRILTCEMTFFIGDREFEEAKDESILLNFTVIFYEDFTVICYEDFDFWSLFVCWSGMDLLLAESFSTS